MPKGPTDAVHSHFIYNEDNNYSQCLYCNGKIKSKHPTNLKNHLSAKHKEQYLGVVSINKSTASYRENNQKIEKKDRENNQKLEGRDKENNQNSKEQDRASYQNVEEQDRYNNQNVEDEEVDNVDIIKLNCLKLVTIHGRPLEMIEDKAFQDIINLALPRHDETKSINIQSIKTMIGDTAYELRSKMANEFQKRLICLKLDCASYQNRTFLGINAQFVQNGTITIRTLATEEVSESQTGENLKEVLLNVLNGYGIDISQIYCITTDNGRNLKRMTKLFGGSYELDKTGEDTDSEAEETDGDEESDDFNSRQGHVNQLIEAVIRDETFLTFKPRKMLCAAHTLQSSVKEMIQSNREVQNLLQRVREAVIVLRAPAISNILMRANLKIPILDSPKSWWTTYNMLIRLQLVKSVCERESFSLLTEMNSLLIESEWQMINDLINSLKPIHETTLKLHKEQLTLGDFFIEWLACKGHLKRVKTQIAQSLLNSMRTREINLLNTKIMLEALFLDTRLNVILSDEEATRAMYLLRETLDQMRKVKRDCELESMLIDETADHGDPSTDEGSTTSGISLVEEILRRTEQQRASVNSEISKTENMLKEIRNHPRLSSHVDILKFWSNKVSSPELSELALCVLATPTTQVSVERLFSSVRYILSPLGCNLSRRVLAEIMIIRCNSDLLEQ